MAHYPTRFETFHGLDKHPNGMPPDEQPPESSCTDPVVKCPRCMGAGHNPTDPPENAPPFSTLTGPLEWTEKCGTCNGWGKLPLSDLLTKAWDRVRRLWTA